MLGSLGLAVVNALVRLSPTISLRIKKFLLLILRCAGRWTFPGVACEPVYGEPHRAGCSAHAVPLQPGVRSFFRAGK